MPHRFDRSILREYDIRGVVGRTLGREDAYAIGLCYAAVMRRAGGSKTIVGRDGRLSSAMLEEALVHGLLAGGVQVVRIGLSSSPMLYFAEASSEDVQGGIQVTGSHNPADHNGFKMVLQGAPLYGAGILELAAIAETLEFDTFVLDKEVEPGRVEHREVVSAYVERLLRTLDGIAPGRLDALRVGWDAGNGAAGPALELLAHRLPGVHHLLFTHVDGTFPNHHPDPTTDANLADLRALVAAKNLDFGVAFDGDADRIGVIDAQGRSIGGDQLLAILAEDLLTRAPGARIIADVKASRVLFDHVASLGGHAEMWNTGHSLIKSRMRETGVLLAGEATGHLFFAEDWYGFDDAFLAALRLIAATVHLGKSVTELHDALPRSVSTPEMRFRVDDHRKFAVIDEVRARLSAANATFSTIDGVRVTTPDGWWLLRASNTENMLVARAESDSETGLGRLMGEMNAQLGLSSLTLPM